MGQTAFIKSSARTLPAIKVNRALHLNLDMPLTIMVAALMMIGLVMVYSTSWTYAKANHNSNFMYLGRQLLFYGMGSVIAIVLSKIDYHKYHRLVLVGVIGTLVALIAVLLFGEERNNSSRTLFGGSIQPSEFAMLMIVIYLAFWLYSKREVLNIISLGLFPMSVIMGLFGGLIYLQPDLSAALTIFILGGLMFYLAGAEARQVILVVIVAVVVGFFVINFTGTGSNRWTQFMAGLQDPIKATEHMQHAFEAISRGGLFGVGIGNSITKFYSLPLPWSDSIFAVIVEETGLFGAFVVVSLYMMILWRGLRIASHASDQLGRLLAGGITFWIVFSALLNMGVMVNLFPFAGNTLPLISLGGSSVITNMVGIGILMNVAGTNSKKESAQTEGRTYGALIDMRRRDRGRRISRSFGSPGIEE